MRSQTLMELKVCLFLQCHIFFTSWPPKEDSVRNWDDQGSYAAMINANISDGSYLPRPAESGGDMHHCITYLAMQFGQGELSVYHAALTRSKGNSWRKRCDLAANRKIRNVSFPRFPNCVIPNSSACCVSIHGSGAGASWTKATKETSQNHNGSQEPETSETLEALQLLWVAKLGEFLLGISVSDFWGGLGLFPHEPHSCCWLWHLPQGATRVPLHRPICDKNTMSIVWPIHVRIIHSVLKFILLVWGDFGPLERTGYDTVSTPTLQKFDSGRWCWTMDWDNRRGFHAVSAVSRWSAFVLRTAGGWHSLCCARGWADPGIESSTEFQKNTLSSDLQQYTLYISLYSLKQKTNLNLVLRLSKRVDLVPCFRIERRWRFRMNLGLFYLQIIDRAIHLCKQCRWSTKDLKRTHRTDIEHIEHSEVSTVSTFFSFSYRWSNARISVSSSDSIGIRLEP